MKRIILSLGIVAIFGILLLSVAKAENKSKIDVTNAPKALKSQTICPVMGNAIDTTVYADIQGQRVFFCCSGCISKMKADPDKYFKKAAEQSVLFQNIQTVCPVSGDKIDSTIYTDYQGRRIYFCCKQCVTDFQKSPSDVLAKMDKPAVKDSSMTGGHDAEHRMHDH